MHIQVRSRCADLDRLDAGAFATSQRADEAVKKLTELRRSDASEEEVRTAQQAVVDARLAAMAARRVAIQQGSGAGGDKPRFDFERGSVIDLVV